MHNPVVALTWHCWRMTKRWYLLILAIAIVGHLGLLNIPAPRNVPQEAFRSVFMASTAVVLNMVLAVFATLYVVTVGGRAGFPLRFEYRLPVSTTLLVTIPLVYLSVVCASLFAIPALLVRLLYDIPIPVVSGVMVIVLIVTMLATANWTTIGSSARTAAVIAAGVGLLHVMGRMKPLNSPNLPVRQGELPRFNPDFLAFSVVQYGELLLLCAALCVFMVYSVGLQRRSDSWRLPGLQSFKQGKPAAAAPSKSDRQLGMHISDLYSVPSPVSSPWLAELWFERKRYGMPVLALGAVLALGWPLLLVVATYLDWPGIKNLAWMPSGVVILVGIGITFINRRAASGGYMNSFEATRGLGTLQLAGAQFLVAGVSIFIGVLLTITSVWLSLPLLSDAGSVISRTQELAAGFAATSSLEQASGVVVIAVLFFATLALFACMHACSVFWGRKVLYVMVVLVFYCLFYIFRIAGSQVKAGGLNGRGAVDASTLESIQHHMWGFSAIVLLLTLAVAGRVLYLRLLSLRIGIASGVTWLAFLVCAVHALQSWGIDLLHQAPELQALNAGLLTLPLTLFLLTAWCYDKLRHR